MFATQSDEGARTALDRGQWAVFHRVIPGDCLTPVLSYEVLRKRGGHSFLLESCRATGERARYSFIGFDPLVSFECREGKAYVDGQNQEAPPLEVLRKVLKKTSVWVPETLPPLIGGFVGFFSYDAVRLSEKIPDRHPKGAMAEIAFSLYRQVLVFDHYHQTVLATVVAREQELDLAHRELQEMVEGLSAIRPRVGGFGPMKGNLLQTQVDVDDERFAQKVLNAKEYIREGDVFQVVLSRCFSSAYEEDPFAIYRALRVVNPAPYMFYLQREECAVAGSSPERLIQCKEGMLETIPLAGTRPRGEGMDDEAIQRDLLDDPKEMAEHMMLVDLARNDLGRVARVGSVKVTDLASVQLQSHVMHIRSVVTAQLKEGLDPIDALVSVMPAGTLSGAPKIRAMEIIDELEESRRGLYGGAVGYLDNRGNLDACIAIRMAMIQDGVATVRAGAGVVSGSDPIKEAQETRQKAEGVLQAVALAKEVFTCC